MTSQRHTSRAAGFTLVELMVVISIVTVLITIAVPSYLSQMRKSKRTDARTALLDLAQREERFMSTNGSYTSDPAKLGYSGAWPVTLDNNDYTLGVCLDTVLPCAANAATGTTYTLTATAVNGQTKDTTCATFTLVNTGLQTATSPNCWTN